MIFLNIGVTMPAEVEHEVDVTNHSAGWVVILSGGDLVVEGAGELEIDGVFSGVEVLMIVDIALSPKSRLIAENAGLFVHRSEFGTPKDAIGMM